MGNLWNIPWSGSFSATEVLITFCNEMFKKENLWRLEGLLLNLSTKWGSLCYCRQYPELPSCKRKVTLLFPVYILVSAIVYKLQLP
jgi:hypothetical protein